MARVTEDRAPAISEIRDWPETLSFSQLSTLHPAYQYSCPRRGAYKYITHLGEQRNWALALGTIVDAGWNVYWGYRITRNPIELAMDKAQGALDAELDHEVSSYPELTQEDPKLARYYAKVGHACLKLLFERFKDVEAAAVQERHYFRIRLNNMELPVVGYSDLIQSNGDIWDLKVSQSARWTYKDDPNFDSGDWYEGKKEVNPATGRRRKVPQPKPDQIEVWHADYIREKLDQMLTYWLARNDVQEVTGRTLDPPLTGKLHLAVLYAGQKIKTPQFHETEITVDYDDANALLRRYAQAGRIVEARRFPLRPGRHCSWCSFLERCREDQAERGRPFLNTIDIPF